MSNLATERAAFVINREQSDTKLDYIVATWAGLNSLSTLKELISIEKITQKCRPSLPACVSPCLDNLVLSSFINWVDNVNWQP